MGGPAVQSHGGERRTARAGNRYQGRRAVPAGKLGAGTKQGLRLRRAPFGFGK
jgi:hypothetical protein